MIYQDMNSGEGMQGVNRNGNKTSESIVLLVDDQMMVAEGIRRMLDAEPDISYHYCNNPADALEMAIDIQPTVILQDLIMPDIDGYTLVDMYRNDEKTKNIQIGRAS